MSTDYDIEMGLDDTLELDTIIENWSPSGAITINPEDTSNNFDLDGFNTYTGVFDPDDPGVYNIDINGQTLKVNVRGSGSKIIVDSFEDGNLSEYFTERQGGNMTVDCSPSISPIDGSCLAYTSAARYGDHIGSTSGLNTYVQDGDKYICYVYDKDLSTTKFRYGFGNGATESDGIAFNLSGSNDKMYIDNRNTGNTLGTQGSLNLSSHQGDWLRMEANINKPNLEFSLYNNNTNNLIGTTTGSSDQFNFNGIHIRPDHNNTSAEVYVDNLYVLR